MLPISAARFAERDIRLAIPEIRRILPPVMNTRIRSINRNAAIGGACVRVDISSVTHRITARA